MKYRYWIFDLDGTLTVPQHDFDAMRADLGLRPGLPILEQLAALPEPARRLAHRQLHAIELELADRAEPAPGAVALVRGLVAAGCRVGIVTRNAAEAARKTLARLELSAVFEGQIISRDDAAAKPDPQGLDLLLDRWRADRSAAVMVGDYLFDLQAGRAAGVETILVAQENRWPEWTDHRVAQLAEIAQLRSMTSGDRVTETVTTSLPNTEPGAPLLALPDPALGEVFENQWSGRYQDIRRLGLGGMGEVRLVRDLQLRRTVALKFLKTELVDERSAMSRFLIEAQAMAQLQHPSILPLHEVGQLPDGRPFFVMPEIRGRTLREAIKDAHEASGGQFSPQHHELIIAFLRVCEAVGYAHGRGVLHRDLKPANIMLGDNGEVLVLDWGVAKLTRDLDEDAEMAPVETAVRMSVTKANVIVGTPAYLPPEALIGKSRELGSHSDIYALGAILFHMLAGRRPYDGRNLLALTFQIATGPPQLDAKKHGIPEELVRIYLKAMSREPTDRHRDAQALVADIKAWLDGSERARAALLLVADGNALLEKAARSLDEADTLSERAEQALADVPSWAPEAEKTQGWRLQDAAHALRDDAGLFALRAEARFQQALTHAPSLEEAHLALAGIYRKQHEAAEAARDSRSAAHADFRLRAHAQSLRPGSDARDAHTTYLSGRSRLRLRTDPDGAEVVLYPYEVENRRLVLGQAMSLGRSPLVDVELDIGSYLLEFRAAGCRVVHLPLQLERGRAWDGVRPGARAAHDIWLPPAGLIDADSCYVPAGWFQVGGDPVAPKSHPAGRLWADGFVIQRFPVRNRDYLSFLNDLVRTGREAEALRWVPRERAGGEALGAVIYGRDASGGFQLQADTDGDVWNPHWPVCNVDWHSANAYAAWYAARTGRPWRLPSELEWEKAARGVDGRLHPWGDAFDPAWACTHDSHVDGEPTPAAVHDFPVDESPYGVRGMAGNVKDWCLEAYNDEPPAGPLVEVRAVQDAPPSTLRLYRGGGWGSVGAAIRVCSRFHSRGTARFSNVGFRLAYGVGEDA